MGCTASTTDHINNNNLSAQNNNSTINANILHHKDYNDPINSSNHQNRVESVNKENIEDLGTEEERSERQEAAIKIQSNFKGYKTRKEFKAKQNIPNNNMKEDETASNVTDENKAATTIQAGFKGYKVRKDNKKPKSETNSEDGSPKKVDDKDSVADEIVKKDQ